MNLIWCLLLSASFFLGPWAFAQDPDQSSDSGVLVSSPIHAQGSDQDGTVNNGGGNALNSSEQGNSNSSGQQRQQHSLNDSGASSQNTTGNSNDSGETSNSNGIVDEATNAVISEMTASLKLTQDQINAIQPIVTDIITKGKNLQQSLVDGTIDAKTMNSQRQQLTGEENMELSSILTPDQMKVWMNMQNDDVDQNQNSSNNSSKHSSSK